MLLATFVALGALPLGLATQGAPQFDGFLRAGCGKDASPESERYSFKENVCKGAPSCDLEKAKMSPEICFNFCRYDNKAFFVIQGQDCYCTSYFTQHIIADGCPWVCEGDQTQRCGGPDAQSLFAMHLCNDSADEAKLALESAKKGEEALSESTRKLEQSMFGLRGLAKSWNFDCGSRQEVCNYDDFWWKSSDLLMNYSRSKKKVRDEAEEGVEELQIATDNLNDESYQILEQATARARGTGRASHRTATGMINEVRKHTYELQKLDAPVDDTLFQEVGEDGKHAICDLEILHHIAGLRWAELEKVAEEFDLQYVKYPDDGEWQEWDDGDEFDEWDEGDEGGFMLHMAKTFGRKNKHHKKHQQPTSFLAKKSEQKHEQKKEGTPSLQLQAQTWCLNHRDCVGFNIEVRSDGAFAVQFLRNKGLTGKKEDLKMAVPVFEFSESTVQQMDLERLGCFALKSYMMDNGYGKTGVDVYKEAELRGGENTRDRV